MGKNFGISFLFFWGLPRIFNFEFSRSRIANCWESLAGRLTAFRNRQSVVIKFLSRWLSNSNYWMYRRCFVKGNAWHLTGVTGKRDKLNPWNRLSFSDGFELSFFQRISRQPVRSLGWHCARTRECLLPSVELTISGLRWHWRSIAHLG